MAPSGSTDARDPEETRALDRVVAFSDAVFAIAITLLVLNFTLPKLHGHDVDRRLFDSLTDDWGLWLSYALSFFIVSRFWIAHHRIGLVLRRVDPRFIRLNLVLLAFIVLLPFPTRIVGEYGDTRTGVVIYAGAMALTGLASMVLWQHARHSGLMDERITATWARHSLARSLTLPAAFLVSIPVAFIDVTAAYWCWALLFVQFIAFSKRLGNIHEPYPGAPAGPSR